MKTHLNRMGRWGAVALSCLGLDLAAATATTSGTTLTIDVADGESYTYAEAIPDGVTTIRKTGAGTCDFGVTPYRTYTGAIYVEAGILSGDPGVGTQGAFGSPSEIHVADGACLKVVNTWFPTGVAAFDGANAATRADQPCTPLNKTHLYVTGAGPDGSGAVWQSAKKSQHNLFGCVTLEGDTTFYSKTRWGIGGAATSIFDMGGHTLTLKGENSFELGRSLTVTRNPGDVNLVSGTLLFENGDPMRYKNGFCLENRTAGELTNRTLRVSANASVVVYNGGCPMKIHGTGTAGQTAKLVLGFTNSDGHIWGDVTADPGFQFNLGWENSGSKGGAFHGRVDVACLNMCGKQGAQSTTSSGNFVVAVSNVQAGASFSNLLVKAETLRFIDAGEVKITGVAKGASWNGQVPDPAASPIRIGMGNGNAYPAYMSVEGKTVLKAAEDTAAGTFPACLIAMYGSGDWDFSILDVKNGGAVYADFFTGQKVSNGAAVYLSGAGSKIVSRGGEACRNWFGRSSAYGTLDIRDGTYQTDGWVCFGENGRGFFVQRGGEVVYGCGTDNGSKLRLARRDYGYGHYIGLGGTFKAGAKGAAQVDLGFCDSFAQSDNYTAAFTVGGAAGRTCDATVKHVRAWMVTNTSVSATALLNLNAGGTLTCQDVYRSCCMGGKVAELTASGGLGDDRFYVNFNGGTLRAAIDTGAFFGSALTAPSRVTVFGGGARLDTAGHNISILSAFEKPYGKGVASVAFTDGEGVKPIGTRAFRVTGATGVAASVVTDFDSQTRTDAANALVCCSGFGYGDDVTVQLEKVKSCKSVSANLTATVSLIDFDAADFVDGGVTKVGAGTLTLQGKNTYRGKTRVEGGTLAFADADGFPGGDIEFSAEALLSGSAKLTAKTLALRSGAKLRVTGADALLAAAPVSFHTVIAVEEPLTTLPEIVYVDADGETLAMTRPWQLRLSADHKTATFGYVRSTVLILR